MGNSDTCPRPTAHRSSRTLRRRTWRGSWAGRVITRTARSDAQWEARVGRRNAPSHWWWGRTRGLGCRLCRTAAARKVYQAAQYICTIHMYNKGCIYIRLSLIIYIRLSLVIQPYQVVFSNIYQVVFSSIHYPMLKTLRQPAGYRSRTNFVDILFSINLVGRKARVIERKIIQLTKLTR